jgi:hypothetical protein
VLATLRMSRDHLSFQVAAACVGTAASAVQRCAASPITAAEASVLTSNASRKMMLIFGRTEAPSFASSQEEEDGVSKSRGFRWKD